MPNRHRTWKPPNKTRPAYDASARLYNTRRWRRLSKMHLAENPLCVTCEKAGRVEMGAAVDHIEPHRGDEGLFWDEANWQSLCKSCHGKKTRMGQ